MTGLQPPQLIAGIGPMPERGTRVECLLPLKRVNVAPIKLKATVCSAEFLD